MNGDIFAPADSYSTDMDIYGPSDSYSATLGKRRLILRYMRYVQHPLLLYCVYSLTIHVIQYVIAVAAMPYGDNLSRLLSRWLVQNVWVSLWTILWILYFKPVSWYLYDRWRDRSVILPPGSTLRRIFAFVYSKKDYTRVFGPAIDDIQFEYIEALAAGEQWRARWVCIRGFFTLVRTVVIHKSTSIIAQVYAAIRLLIGG
jgi:hypothetical protein